MDRPVRPEPADVPQIKRAFRVARRMQWLPLLTGLPCGLGACFIGSFTSWYIGLSVFVIVQSAVMAVGFSLARCPKCGKVWGISELWRVGILGEADNELETLVCQRCRLDIGFGLRG